MDVRQRSRGVGRVFRSGKSEGADFLSQHTMLQVCHYVATLLVKGTTIIAW